MVNSHQIYYLVESFTHAGAVERLTRMALLQYLEDNNLLPDDFKDGDWVVSGAGIYGEDLCLHDNLGNVRLRINLKDL